MMAAARAFVVLLTLGCGTPEPSFSFRRAVQDAGRSSAGSTDGCPDVGLCTCGAHSDCLIGHFCAASGLCEPCAALAGVFECTSAFECKCPRECCSNDELLVQCPVSSFGSGQACFSSTSPAARASSDVPTCLSTVGSCGWIAPGCGCHFGEAAALP